MDRNLESCRICTIESYPWNYVKQLHGYICKDCHDLTRWELMSILIERLEKLELIIKQLKDSK